MFCGYSSLKELNLSNFNINKVKDMSWLLCGCSSLEELNLPDFSITNLSNMRGMFSGCSDDLKKKISFEIKNIKAEAFN